MNQLLELSLLQRKGRLLRYWVDMIWILNIFLKKPEI